MGATLGAPGAPGAVVRGWGHVAEPSRCGQTPLDLTAQVNLVKKMTDLSSFTENLGMLQRAVVVVTKVDIAESIQVAIWQLGP